MKISGQQYLILIIGLVAVSFASILIKLCNAPSLMIAVYRLSIASLFYLSFSKFRTGTFLPSFSKSEWRIAIISGIFLTIHFATWITSLAYTSVASSVVLVQSAPVFVAIGSYIFIKEKPILKMLIGILITLTGSIIISVHDFNVNQSSMIGNLLAIGGALGAAGYMIAGRQLRRTVDTLRYVTVVYSTAAIMLIILASISGASPIGYSRETYFLLLAIAIIPQIIGHTVINWSLKFFSATTVSVIILAEPIGASILAWFLLSEQLSLIQAVGGIVILVGVLIVLLSEREIRRNRNSS